MAETTIRTLVCSVMFLDIVDYSKRSVGDQQHMKQTFTELLARALEPVPPRDFIVLDTGDGAAIAFLGDPEDALSAGIAVRKSIASLPPEMLSARMGINLGPVRLVWDINAQMNILGDGINVAQRVMSFAKPGQLLASRSFYEVVSRLFEGLCEPVQRPLHPHRQARARARGVCGCRGRPPRALGRRATAQQKHSRLRPRRNQSRSL